MEVGSAGTVASDAVESKILQRFGFRLHIETADDVESLFLDTNRRDSREGRQQEQRPSATGREVSDRELTATFVGRNSLRRTWAF